MTPAPLLIRVSARLERSNKGRRVRVRCVEDGRAVQCCTAWRARLGDSVATIRARDAGAHWRMVPDGAA